MDGQRQRAQHGDALEQADVHVVHDDGAVEGPQPPPGRHRQDGAHEADAHQPWPDARRPRPPSDATTAPTPMDSATRLSSTPNTRASTSSGAIRPRSVKPATSISALPTPTQGQEAQRRGLSCGTRPIEHQRQAPERDPDGEPRAESPGADEERRCQRAQDGARADGGR